MGGFDDDESTEIVNNAEIGGFFGGRFRIDARLGSGAMGKVLTALDTETGRLVALKVLHRERSRDKNVLRRFAREAASLRAINHRAIVGIVASGRAPDGTPWLAMEHLVGQTLKARIAKQKLQPAEFWPILKTLAEAVGEAHARGVVHRDLKPENIFVPQGDDPPCKILDFGLATLNREGADKVTATGQLLGTPRYMAPELLASIGKPDHRVDVFALAVVSFEALTGRSLYSADDLGSLFGQILEARTHSLREFRPDLPEALERVLKQGHARSMSDRFATAGEFAQAFAQAAGIGDSISARPALAGLFDEVAEPDGNAPLVDPFGAPARATGPQPALPPLAADVAPLMELPQKKPSNFPARTQMGVAPAGFPMPGMALPPPAHAYPAPNVHAAQSGQHHAQQVVNPWQPTPAQAISRAPIAAAIAQATHVAPVESSASAQATLYNPQGYDPHGLAPPRSMPPAAMPVLGTAAQAGSGRGFTPPAPPRFSAAPAIPQHPPFAAAPAAVAAPSSAPSAQRNWIGCAVFAVAAIAVVALAIAGAIALRYLMARGML
jgi:hypothetical protein